MLTIPRTTKREETSYDRAIAKAARCLLIQITCGLVELAFTFSPYGVRPIPTSLTGLNLAPGGKLEGATCTCQGHEAESCKHRELAHLKFEEWLETDQGFAWADSYYCAKCREQPKLPGQELCHQCAPVVASAQVAIDEVDLFGAA
jgi:hypothetical protein